MGVARIPSVEGGIQPTLLTTKGDILAATAASTVSRLAVGTNNQTLVAASGEATGLKYANGSVSTLTTTGDILYASGANTLARLGIGSAGQVLTVSGGLPSYATPAGSKVVQIVTATYATETTNSTTTYADTGLTATITPTSASNKVLVLVSQNGVAKTSSNANSGVGIKLMRGATDILTLSNQAAYTASAVANNVGTVGCEFLDSPATTSATIYKTQFKQNIAASAAVVQEYNISSTIVLMEVTP